MLKYLSLWHYCEICHLIFAKYLFVVLLLLNLVSIGY
jgi:hypothetical protein